MLTVGLGQGDLNMKKLLRLFLLSMLVLSLTLLSATGIMAQDDDDEPTADELYELGYSAYLDDDYETAIDEFTNALELDSTLASAYFYRAISNYNLGNADESMLSDLNSAIEYEFFDIPWAHNIRGLTHVRMGNYEDAIVDYTQALTLSPTYILIYRNRSIAYQQLGDWASAASDSKASLEADPERTGVYNSIAWIYVQLGRYEDALGYVSVELERNPDLNYAIDTLGWAYLGLGQYFEAIDAFERAIELGEEYSYYGLGVAYNQLGTIDIAIENLEAYIEIYGDNAEQEAIDLLAELQSE